MSGEKTISLDLSLFTDKGKNSGTKSSKGTKTNKTIRKERKLKPKVNGQNVKSLRKNLLAKIKEHQKKENHENLSSKKRNSYDNSDSNNNNNNNNDNKQNVKVINAEELFDDEFTKSLSYLSALSKSREDKKQERKKKKNMLRLQPKPQLQPQLQPKPQLQSNNLKIAKPIGNNVNVKHKTIKQSTRNANIPDISLDLPPELDEPKIDIDILPSAVTSKVNKGSSILGFKPNITLLNEKSDIQSSNNDHKEPKQSKQPKKPNVFMNLPKINNDPPFGVLKNGNKPTFRQFNKTQKKPQKNPIKIENSSNKPNIRIEPTTTTTTTTTRQNVLNNLREKRQINSNANYNSNTYANVSSQFNNSLNRSKPMVIPENKSKNKKTIRRTITTRKFKLGKNGKKRIISVLVKNNSTRRNIKQEVGKLKQTPIKEIKAYLRKHGMLKVGSSAPNDVLRHIYENSVLSGDIRNMSKDTLIHNFFNDKEEF